jgi:20S proteasome subunit alpha 3
MSYVPVSPLLAIPPFCLIIVEMATLTRENGKTKTRILSAKEVEELITAYEKAEAEAEAAKREQKQKS